MNDTKMALTNIKVSIFTILKFIYSNLPKHNTPHNGKFYGRSF
jgi:hypothetical protein